MSAFSVFSLQDALLLVAERARLIDELPGGAMLAVQLPEEAVPELLGTELPLAAVNGGAPASYARQLCRPVRFGAGPENLWQQPGRVFLEVGPGQSPGTLALQARPRDADAGSLVLASLPGVHDHDSDGAFVVAATGKLWLAGITPDWDAVQAERRRAALPTYPLEHRRYRPDGGAPGAPPADAMRTRSPGHDRVACDGRRELTRWFYAPRWEPLASVSRTAERAEPARWLIFADELGLAERLVQKLAERGESVVTVRRGTTFVAAAQDSYVINPDNGEDYHELLLRIQATGGLPTKIVHMWLVGDRPADPTDRAVVENVLHDGFASLLSLAQAVGREALAEAIEVSVVSTEMHAFAEADRCQPAKSLALGPCRVWPLENASVSCRSVDIALPPADVTIMLQRAGELLTELRRPIPAGTGTEVLAIRGRHRWRQTFQPVPLDEAPAHTPRFRVGGTYLITGGLGGIGLSLAGYLAQTVQPNIVLVSRFGLPPREEWSWWAGRPAGDSVTDRIRAVQRLEEAGAAVLVARADVADADQLAAVVDETLERFGTIHGVVHAAGVPGGGLIQLKDLAAAEGVLAPKVQGALALRSACASLELDFLVYCSSRIAVTGGVGQVDYCAANSFLDALAHHDEHSGRGAVVSINWDAWQDVGMAARTIGGAKRPCERELRHPLLTRRLAGDQRYSIYSTHFDAAESWLVDEHRMLGRAVVPGVGHLELVRAAFADDRGQDDQHDQGIEFADVTFYTSIVVPENGDKEVRVVLERAGADTRFAVISDDDDPSGDGARRWRLHSSGRVAPLAAAERRTLDLEALIDRVALRSIERPVHEKPMCCGARSQCLQRMYVGDSEFMARIELPEPFAADLERLHLHPSLMEIATAFVGLHRANEFWIPVSYRRIQMFAPLPAVIYSYQSYRDDDHVGKETVTSDVVITDQDGRELVRADQFVLKKVHDLGEGLTAALYSGAEENEIYDHPVVSADERTEAPTDFLRTALDHGMSAEEGLEVLDRILGWRLAPHALVSTRDLASVLDQVGRARSASVGGAKASDSTPAPGDSVRPGVGRSRHPRPDLLTAYEAPRDGLESRLAALWQDLLGVAKVGIHDHFFDLGGHSLHGLQLVAQLRAAFAVNIPIGSIFDALTVADLSAVLRDAGATQSADAKSPLGAAH